MKYIKIGASFQVAENFAEQTQIFGIRIDSDFYKLTKDGILLVRKGYTWDGASGAVDTKSILKASCIHDILCELINAGKLAKSYQRTADKHLVEIIGKYWKWIKANGKWSWKDGQWIEKIKAHLLSPFTTLRRKYIYRAVRIYQANKLTAPQIKVLEVP